MSYLLKAVLVTSMIVLAMVAFSLPIALVALASVQFHFNLSIQMLGLAGVLGILLACATIGVISDHLKF